MMTKRVHCMGRSASDFLCLISARPPNANVLTKSLPVIASASDHLRWNLDWFPLWSTEISDALFALQDVQSTSCEDCSQPSVCLKFNDIISANASCYDIQCRILFSNHLWFSLRAPHLLPSCACEGSHCTVQLLLDRMWHWNFFQTCWFTLRTSSGRLHWRPCLPMSSRYFGISRFLLKSFGQTIVEQYCTTVPLLEGTLWHTLRKYGSLYMLKEFSITLTAAPSALEERAIR